MSAYAKIETMIYLVLGNNTYRAEQEVVTLEKKLGLVHEQIDAGTLSLNNLADIIRGGMLFNTKRLVVVSGLSAQKPLWDKLAEWACDVSDDTTLVLIESKLDRRTRSYKLLIKSATVILANRWRDKERGLAEEWLLKFAKDRGVKLSSVQIKNMVERSRVAVEGESYLEIDQHMLARAVKSLDLLDSVTDEAIATVLPPAAQDTVFDLLQFATRRDTGRMMSLLTELRLNESPHRVFALLATQWAQLVTLSLGDSSSATMAAELSIHPFVAQKLHKLAGEYTYGQLRRITTLVADIDAGMKLSQFDPWDGIERFLLGVSLR